LRNCLNDPGVLAERLDLRRVGHLIEPLDDAGGEALLLLGRQLFCRPA